MNRRTTFAVLVAVLVLAVGGVALARGHSSGQRVITRPADAPLSTTTAQVAPTITVAPATTIAPTTTVPAPTTATRPVPVPPTTIAAATHCVQVAGGPLCSSGAVTYTPPSTTTTTMEPSTTTSLPATFPLP